MDVIETLNLCKADGTSKPASDVLEGKDLVALYFSAHWCPPCRAFTPVLKDFYGVSRGSICLFFPTFVLEYKTLEIRGVFARIYITILIMHHRLRAKVQKIFCNEPSVLFSSAVGSLHFFLEIKTHIFNSVLPE
jgi:thiol-disulfide isomerase/thioredoxin